MKLSSRKHSAEENIFNILNILFMIAFMLVTLYPFSHLLMASLSQSNKYIAHQGLLFWPVGTPNLTSYKKVLDNPNIFSGFQNTVFVVILGVIVNIVMTALGAYFLSRKNVLWQKLIMLMIVFTMYFNGGLIPTYLTVRNLGLYNSLFALILPTAINTTNLIIMRTAFAAVPDSLEESAKIDGAGHFRILFSIYMPLTMATTAVLILYYGVGHWNSWFNAMIYLRKREKFPLQLILREILILNSTESMTMEEDAGEVAYAQETIKAALTVISIVPILVLYPFLQRYFVKGVMIGSLKG